VHRAPPRRLMRVVSTLQVNGVSRVVRHQAVEQLPVRADIGGFHFETPDIYNCTHPAMASPGAL